LAGCEAAIARLTSGAPPMAAVAVVLCCALEPEGSPIVYESVIMEVGVLGIYPTGNGSLGTNSFVCVVYSCERCPSECREQRKRGERRAVLLSRWCLACLCSWLGLGALGAGVLALMC
jgi:hypothetical protein